MIPVGFGDRVLTSTMRDKAQCAGSSQHGQLAQRFRQRIARPSLWGADLSRLTSCYRQCLDQVRLSLDFLSAEDREWIVGKALAEVLHWSEVSSSGRALAP